LCFGDSGGPAFVFLDAAKNRRVIAGVNSRGNIVNTSWIVSTSTQFAKDFLSQWAAAKAVHICGVTAAAPKCR